mmetsp:Transcript_57981/g.138025  ORF Transcript_57981/g.138025 Transcript_57981/m.138025 type:complete len:114 (-) Transcript_57981:136-477(-)
MSHTSLLAAVAQVVARLPAAAPDTSSAADEHLARRHTATRDARPTPACDKPQSVLNLFASRRLSIESTPSTSPSKSPWSKPPPARHHQELGTIASDLRSLRKASCPIFLDVEA